MFTLCICIQGFISKIESHIKIQPCTATQQDFLRILNFVLLSGLNKDFKVFSLKMCEDLGRILIVLF